MHIRDLRRLRPILDYKTAYTIATTIVHSKLDYRNSLFYSIDACQLKRLQTIQNAHARAVTKTPKHHHITPALAKSPSTHPLQNCISYLQCSSNLSTLLHTPITHHSTARVYSLSTISFSISASSLILSEV